MTIKTWYETSEQEVIPCDHQVLRRYLVLAPIVINLLERFYCSKGEMWWKASASLAPSRIQLDCWSATRTQIINLPTNQKGYDTFETTVGKLSARRIQICFVYFCKINFWPLIFWNKWKQDPNKKSQSRFGFASLNSLVPRSQTLLRCLGGLAFF